MAETVMLQLTQTTFEDPRVEAILHEWDAELLAADPASDPSSGSTVRGEDFAPPRGAFLLATRGEAPAGCGGLRPLGPHVGEIKRLFVRRPERRRGTGRALLLALEHRAVVIGYRSLRLDTDGSPASLALFRSAGFTEIPDYNNNERARAWFEKRL
jgi:GNAT superfamily N-acetyltransferase